MTAGNRRPPARYVTAADPVADWALLMPGEPILVTEENGNAESGTIDVVAADSSVLWIHSMFGRRLFMKIDNCQVWRPGNVKAV